MFDAYAPRILRLGRHVCDSPDSAEDLVQETFLRALAAWDAFEGRAAESTWLYTIATRACQRLERRRAGEPRRFVALIPDEGAPVRQLVSEGTSDPLAELERLDRDAALRAAVASLPPDFRLPLMLKDLEGLSLAEVSDVLDAPVATVKTRVHRARLKVAAALASHTGALHRVGETADRECADLLSVRQGALDRGAPFPLPDAVVCDRCRATFEALDGARTVCATLASEPVDARILERIRDRLKIEPRTLREPPGSASALNHRDEPPFA